MLLEREPRLAAGASGNAAGLLMPWMARVPEARTRFSVAGFEFTRCLARSLEARGLETGLRQDGALRFANTDRLRRFHAECPDTNLVRALGASEASAVAGIPVTGDALHFPTACTLSPPAFCRAMLAVHPELVAVRTCLDALSFHRTDASTWLVRGSDGAAVAEAPTLVIAASNDCVRFPALSWLPLEPVRGQVVHLDRGHPALDNLRVALCSDGYVARAPGGGFVIGASFEHGNDSTILDDATQRRIMDAVGGMVPGFGMPADVPLPGRVGFRSSAPDHMPIIGSVPEPQMFARQYQTVRYSHLGITWSEPWWIPGLYVTTAHASHGLATAPLAGEMIAADACGDRPEADCGNDDRKSVNPLRFLVARMNRESGKSPHRR